MKILVVAQNLIDRDGWGTIARNTVMGLQDRGHEVCVVLHDLDHAGLCPEMDGLPPANALLGSPTTWFRTAFAIRKAVKAFNPDVIHIAVEPYALAMPIVKYFVQLPPWVLIMLGTYTVQPLYLYHTRLLMKRVYQECDAFPVCSRYTREQFLQTVEKKCGQELRRKVEEKTSLFRLGIAPITSVPHAPNTKELKKILFVGGVKPRKGVLDVVKGLRAYSLISSVPFQADIIGQINEKSAYTEAIRNEITEGNLEEVVTLHGHSQRAFVDEAFARANVFIMLSKPDGIHFEGFGMVFLEANVRGVPTIGPDGSGCKEAIEEGVSGFIVDPEDSAAVAERLKWVLEDQKIQPDDCIEWAKQHSIDQQVASFETVYASLVK